MNMSKSMPTIGLKRFFCRILLIDVTHKYERSPYLWLRTNVPCNPLKLPADAGEIEVLTHVWCVRLVFKQNLNRRVILCSMNIEI